MNSYHIGLVESYIGSIFNVLKNVAYDYEEAKDLGNTYTLLRSSSDGSYISLMINKSDSSYMVNFSFSQTGDMSGDGLGRISCQYNFIVLHDRFDLIGGLVNIVLETCHS